MFFVTKNYIRHILQAIILHPNSQLNPVAPIVALQYFTLDNARRAPGRYRVRIELQTKIFLRPACTN